MISTSSVRTSDFYPRPPRGGRRWTSWLLPKRPAISIHALREEGDRSSSPRRARRINFYPRPPRGGRPLLQLGDVHLIAISIHALREEGDNQEIYAQGTAVDISIHALREEGDRLPQ